MASKTSSRPGNRPYSGKPRRKPVASDFDDPFDAPTPAERRRIDEEQSRPYRESYEEGRKQGRQESKSKSGKSGHRPSSSRRKRRVPGAVSARTAARQLQAPVRAQVTSGLRIAGVTLALVALYNVLTTPGPEAFSGVLNGLSRALTWLSMPTPVPKR
jgi:hypothetical protein